MLYSPDEKTLEDDLLTFVSRLFELKEPFLKIVHVTAVQDKYYWYHAHT